MDSCSNAVEIVSNAMISQSSCNVFGRIENKKTKIWQMYLSSNNLLQLIDVGVSAVELYEYQEGGQESLDIVREDYADANSAVSKTKTLVKNHLDELNFTQGITETVNQALTKNIDLSKISDEIH